MSIDPLTDKIDTAAVNAADTGIAAAKAAVDAIVAQRLPGFSAVLVPIVAEGAAELRSLVAEYVPKLVLAAEHEVESLMRELGDKLKALVHGKAPLVPAGSPLDLLSNDDLAALYSALHGADPMADGVVVDGWTTQSIRENGPGIDWLMAKRTIIRA